MFIAVGRLNKVARNYIDNTWPAHPQSGSPTIQDFLTFYRLLNCVQTLISAIFELQQKQKVSKVLIFGCT